MKTTTINDQGLVRLVSETHYKPPVLGPLVDTDDEMENLAEFEGETSSRRIAEHKGGPALVRRASVDVSQAHGLSVYGQSLINAAFTYTRSTGNRFNGKDWGAWYCSYEAMTTIYEVGFHRTRELENINIFEDEVRYVELLADFIGKFPNLDGETHHAALNADPDIGYPAGQELATSLYAAGHRGLLYPSVRHPGGRCFVAFEPSIIQNVRRGAIWKLTWNGAPEYSIKKL